MRGRAFYSRRGNSIWHNLLRYDCSSFSVLPLACRHERYQPSVIGERLGIPFTLWIYVVGRVLADTLVLGLLTLGHRLLTLFAAVNRLLQS